MKIYFEKTNNCKEKPTKDFGFGKYYTDYMFLMDYDDSKGWHDARVVPYAPLSLDPVTMVLHYAQETFEGLKAYRKSDDEILLFRPEMNAKRFANSNERLCMPQIPVEDFVEAVEALVYVEKDWVPSQKEHSLYIRPFCYASQTSVGAHPSKTYQFVIVLSPVGAYYANGLNPVSIYVEDEYVRAAPGGTGFTKCGGNYAGAFAAQKKAEKMGYDQVLWLDGVHKKYVEEVGAMNVMFLVDDTVYTAPTDGTVLPGVTRDSILTLLKEKGYKTKEEHFTIDFLMQAAKQGRLKEAFGTGTAAVISPIGKLYYKGETVTVNNGEIGTLTQKLYDTLTGIQWGLKEDTHNWSHKVKNNFSFETK